MIDEKNINNLPFEEGGAGLYGHKPRAMHVSPPRYMTTRASVFLAFTVFGLNLALLSDVAIYIPFACSLAMLLFWCISLRFFRTSWAAPLVVFIMMIPALAAGYYFNSVTLAGSLSVFSLGLGTLCHLNRDDAEEDVRPAVLKEVLIPFMFACIAVLFGHVASYLSDHRFLFLANIFSVAFLILTSILISKTSGSRYFFTSKHLTEFWDIPVAEFSQVKIFFFTKAKFIMTVLWLFAVVIAIHMLVPFAWRGWITIPAAALAVLPFIYIVPKSGKDRGSLFGSRYFMYEVYIAAIITSMFFFGGVSDMPVSRIIYAFLLVIGNDIIGSALLAVIRRRQIFVSRSKYIDGTPFMMTMFSLMIMLVECCVYNMI